MMWKQLTALTSPGGGRGTLTVLFYHRVLPVADRMLSDTPTAQSFDEALGWVQSQFNVLPLAEAARRLGNGSLPPAAAAITFDDGYADNLTVAAPLLARRQLPATFFVATGFLDGGIMFNDAVIECLRGCKRDTISLEKYGLASLPLRSWADRQSAVNAVLNAFKYLPFKQRSSAVRYLARETGVTPRDDLMLTTPQLQALAAIPHMDIGAHTDQHPILCTLNDAEARHEIVYGRERLQSMLDRQVSLFAYPNGRDGGDFDHRHRQMVKEAGYDAAFSTEPCVCHAGDDPLALPRFTPWDSNGLRFRLRMLAAQRRRLATVAPARLCH